MKVRDLLIGGSADRRWLVGVGMRNCAQLGNEQRQRNQGCDAKFQAMRPVEQRAHSRLGPWDAITVRAIWELWRNANRTLNPDGSPLLPCLRSMNLNRDVREAFESLKQRMVEGGATLRDLAND